MLNTALTLALFFATLLNQAHASDTKPGTVTIPVDEYIQLREAKKAPELTTVESVVFDGAFGKSLTMTVSGTASGAPKSVDILQRSDAFGVRDCGGTNAMLSGGDNRLNIVPLRPERFKITCQIQVRNWAQVEFNVDNALFVGAKVSGGEALIRDNGGSQIITLVRPSAPSEDTKAPLAVVARYRVTVQPEESRFQYEFQISNPNRTLRRLKISKTNGEIFSQIRTTIQHQESEDGLNLELQPGDNVVRAEGRFAGQTFTPPVEGQSFLLVENSPTLQLTIESASRRVSPKDAGIASRYAGARAFIIAKDQKVSWEARKLDVFSALGYSVSWARYLYYVPRRGSPIVEATFQINNQGTPEVALDVPGQVTYLEVGGEAQVLSRDKDGKLLLQLPSGEQNVVVQYLSKVEHGSLLAIPNELLARPAAVLSNVNMSLSLDPRWSLPFGRSLFEINSDLSIMDFVWAGLIALVGFLIFRELGMGSRDRTLLPLSLFVAVAAAPWLFFWMALTFGVYLIIRYREELLKRWPNTTIGRLLVLGALGLAAFFIFVSALLSPGRNRETSRFASEQLYNKMESIGDAGGGGMAGAPMSARGSAKGNTQMDSGDMELSEAAGGDYQGIPARLSIPEGRAVVFHQGVMDAKTPVKIGAVLINRALGEMLMIFALLFTLGLIYQNRKSLIAGARLNH